MFEMIVAIADQVKKAGMGDGTGWFRVVDQGDLALVHGELGVDPV
jgi:hypothetical protein